MTFLKNQFFLHFSHLKDVKNVGVIVYCAPRAKAGFCLSRIKLSPEAKPRGFQLYTRHKRPFLLEVHILFCRAAERKRIFAFENIQSGFKVTDVLLVAICYLSCL